MAVSVEELRNPFSKRLDAANKQSAGVKLKANCYIDVSP